MWETPAKSTVIARGNGSADRMATRQSRRSGEESTLIRPLTCTRTFIPLFSTVISRLLVEVIAIYVKHSPHQASKRFKHTILNHPFAIQDNLTLHAAFHNNAPSAGASILLPAKNE